MPFPLSNKTGFELKSLLVKSSLEGEKRCGEFGRVMEHIIKVPGHLVGTDSE